MTTGIRLGAYQATLQDQVETLDLIFTSPPYNIGSKSPRIDGQRKKGKYDPKSYGSITGYADNLPEDRVPAPTDRVPLLGCSCAEG